MTVIVPSDTCLPPTSPARGLPDANARLTPQTPSFVLVLEEPQPLPNACEVKSKLPVWLLVPCPLPPIPDSHMVEAVVRTAGLFTALLSHQPLLES